MIEELTLHEFRNYPSLTHRFQTGLNIFVGKNGCGKTNLLEAIHFLLRGRSFRNIKQNDLTRHHRGDLAVKLTLTVKDDPHSLTLSLNNGKKKIFWDNKPLEEMGFLRQKIKVIFFSSQDIDLILLSPAKRREFFDEMLSSLKEEYHTALVEYQRVLQHRNRELSQFKKSIVWDEKIITYGQRIDSMRVSFLKAIAPPLKKIFYQLSRDPDFNPRIAYCCDGEILENPIAHEAYRQKLESYRNRDEIRGFTTFGPHSDDYFFYLQNNLSKSFSSQGENRLFVFALKFALNEYYQKAMGKYPLLILDDVFNDFDPDRLKLFYRYLEKQNQVILACANESLFQPFIDTKKSFIHFIDKGIINRWNSKN